MNRRQAYKLRHWMPDYSSSNAYFSKEFCVEESAFTGRHKEIQDINGDLLLYTEVQLECYKKLAGGDYFHEEPIQVLAWVHSEDIQSFWAYEEYEEVYG